MSLKKSQKINGGFIVIPKHTLECDDYKYLNTYTKIVYQTLLINFIRDKTINPGNQVCMTYSQIKKIANISERQIQRSIKELEIKGFISTIHQGGLERNASIYEINGRYIW